MALALILALALAVSSDPAQDAAREALRAHDAAVSGEAVDLREIEALRDTALSRQDANDEARRIRDLTLERSRKQLPAAVRSLGGNADQAQALAVTTRADMTGEPATNTHEASGVRYVVFVTQAMPEAELREVATSLPANGVMVLRGFMEGQSLMTLSMRVRGWADDPSTLGTVQIDPRPFQDLAVHRAPAVAMQRDGEWLAIVYGTTGITYLTEQVESGRRGDLGQIGPVLDIIETDLLTKMEAEMPALLEARARAAVADFLSSVDFQHLPEAQAYSERLIDPSIRVTEDVILPDGTVIARKGDLVNPFAARPFTTRLIVADLRVEWQREFARDLADASQGRHRVMVLASNMDTGDGWGSYHRQAEAIGQHIFLLTDEVARRFRIEAVPTVVDGAGESIRVRTIPRQAVVDVLGIDARIED